MPARGWVGGRGRRAEQRGWASQCDGKTEPGGQKKGLHRSGLQRRPGGAGSQLLIKGLVLGVLILVAPLKAPRRTRRPKGEKKVADQEGDAVIKESRPVTENPGRFSHNCAPDVGSLFCLFVPPQVSGRRENSLLGRPATQWLCFYHREGFVSGSGDSVCEKLDNVTRADSRTLGYHISLPKHLPNCGVETLLLRKFSKNQNIT